MNSKRGFQADRLVIVIGLVCFGPSPASAQEIKIGITGNGVSTFSLRMAEAGGFYKKQGLNVQVVNLEGGTRGLQVLLSGKIQAISSGLSPVLQANRQGADVRMVASTWNTIPFAVFSLPQVKSGADLKGGTIGISTFGSEPDIAVTLALKQLGLNRKDVTIVQMGENSKRLNALLAGYISATPLAEPAASIAREQGLSSLVDLTNISVPSGIVVARAYLDSERDLLTRVLRAIVEATYFSLANEKSAKEVIAAIFKTNSAKAIDNTYMEFRRLIPRDLEVSADGVENVIEQMQAIGIKLGSKNFADHADNSIVQSLKAEGFLAATKRKYNLP